MIGNNRIAVVIPAYQAAATVASVIRGLPDFVDAVIVVDDGSSDGTRQAAESVGDPRVTCVSHARNAGVGAAMATGYAQALAMQADVAVKMDADGQMNPDALPDLLAPITELGFDYSKGNRFYYLHELCQMPLARRLGNAALAFLMKAASGYWNLYDPQNGFLAIRADTLCRLDLHSLDHGYFFENSMLIQLNVLSARVAEVPMPARYGGECSSMRLSRVLIGFPYRLFLGWLTRVRLKYCGIDFSPIAILMAAGFLLVISGLLYGVREWVVHARQGIPTPAGAVMLAALPVLFGAQLLLHALLLDIGQTPPGLGIQRIASKRRRAAETQSHAQSDRAEAERLQQ
jgi:glycosyltransferase involved in cell wall biosynthesis